MKNPGTFQRLKGMRLLDALYLAEVETHADLAHVELFRRRADGVEELVVLNASTMTETF